MNNPFQEASVNKKTLTLIGIYLGIIGDLLVSSGFSTMLPAAALEIGGKDIYPMANTIGGVLGISAMPLYGYLASRNPAIKRPLFAISLIIGALVVFLRGTAQSMWGIIIPSAFWGAVSAAVFVLGFSMISEMYDVKKAGVYLGIVGTVMSVALLIGPTLTGVLIDNVSWRMVNHAIWPVLAASGIVTLLGVKVSKEDAKTLAAASGAFDYVGAGAMTIFLAGIILFLSLGTSYVKFGTTGSYILLAIAVIGLTALILIISRKKTAAIIPATVLKDRNTLCLTVCNFMSNFSNMAVFFFMPAYVLYVMNGTAFQAGLATTIMAVPGLFLGPILGKKIAEARNARGVMTFGLTVRILVTLCFVLFLTPTISLWSIYALMLISGIYSSQQGVTFSTAPQIQIKSSLRIMGNSIIQVSQNLGAAIAIAIYTLMISMSGLVQGLKISMILAIGAAVIAMIFGLMLKTLEDPKVEAK
jgi:MFS family permease